VAVVFVAGHNVVVLAVDPVVAVVAVVAVVVVVAFAD